jgi:hypothetical protein
MGWACDLPIVVGDLRMPQADGRFVAFSTFPGLVAEDPLPNSLDIYLDMAHIARCQPSLTFVRVC